MSENANKLIIDIRDNPHKLGLLAGFDKLTSLHSDWIKYIWNPSHISRSLQAHRYSYKTTSIIVIGVIYWLLFNPDDTIGIVRKTVTDAQECVNNIAVLMQKPEFIQLFYDIQGIAPKLLVNRSEKLVFNFKKSITREGSVNAYGIKTGATGKHLDAAIFDDFVTIDDRISAAERKRTATMMEEFITNVINPSGLSAFIGTPWHREDCWSLKSIPSPKKFNVYQTKILLEEEIQKKRTKMTNVMWSANYELKHTVSENAIFKDPHFESWQYQYKTGIGHIDKKFHGTDTLAITFCCKKPNGRYQTIGWVFDDHIKNKWDFIAKKWRQYYIGTVYTENNDDKGACEDQFYKQKIPCELYHESTNKHVKIMSFLHENGFWDLIDFDTSMDNDPAYQEYIAQILDYREKEGLDDAVDSLSCIGRKMRGNSSHYTDRWR